MSPGADLDARNVAGGQERQTGGPFPVTAELVEAALHTALFTSRGHSRLGPCHATFGAYLAARYLASRQLPEAQLRALLTARTETGSTGIIPALRETAAWLVALRPGETTWLAEVDPDSLVAHAAIIEDSAIRALVVDRLLDDPGPALHGSWLHRWRLAHPGLASQLLRVLSPLADPSADAPVLDQAYLALLLAEENKPPELLPTLLAIALRTDVDVALRAKATTAAAALDSDESSASTLRRILDELDAEPGHDPHDELRGALLLSLWPKHLTVHELVGTLTKPKNVHMIGLYAHFRDQLPDLLSDADVPAILRWVVAGTSITDPEVGPSGEINNSPHLDAELASKLLDRALRSADTQRITAPTADTVSFLLKSHHELVLPEPLDRRGPDGQEPVEARELRRGLALAVLERLEERRAHLVIATWLPSEATILAQTAVNGGMPARPRTSFSKRTMFHG